MKVLVVSDLHANSEALRRLPEEFDHVLCLGDLVDYGPDPEPCIEWVRERAAVTVRGNHDEAVARRVSCGCSPSFRPHSEATRELMWRKLGQKDIEFFGSLPLKVDVVLGNVRFHLLHATPSDPLHTYLKPNEAARWEAEVEQIDADVVLVGHTHLPMVLRFGKKVLVNPGSVGQPRDGDPRAAFAVIEDGEPRLGRVEYGIEATVTALGLSGYRIISSSRLLECFVPVAGRAILGESGESDVSPRSLAIFRFGFQNLLLIPLPGRGKGFERHKTDTAHAEEDRLRQTSRCHPSYAQG